jgi:hypothetical protein
VERGQSVRRSIGEGEHATDASADASIDSVPTRPAQDPRVPGAIGQAPRRAGSRGRFREEPTNREPDAPPQRACHQILRNQRRRVAGWRRRGEPTRSHSCSMARTSSWAMIGCISASFRNR